MITQIGSNLLILAGWHLKKIIDEAKLCSYPVLWSPILDMHHSIFDSVCCHTLQLPLHIISNAHLFPIATCAPNCLFSTVTIALLRM